MQRLASKAHNLEVVGSSPTPATNFSYSAFPIFREAGVIRINKIARKRKLSVSAKGAMDNGNTIVGFRLKNEQLGLIIKDLVGSPECPRVAAI